MINFKIVFCTLTLQQSFVSASTDGYAANFETSWPTNPDLDAALDLQLSDAGNLCDPAKASTADCMAKISTTMSNIVTAYNTINKYFGSGPGNNQVPSMTPWFLGTYSADGLSKLQKNFGYLQKAVSTMKKLVMDGSTEDIATLLNTPSGKYVNLKTAYANVVSSVASLSSENTKLQGLVSTLVSPVTEEISRQEIQLGGKYGPMIIEDEKTVQGHIDTNNGVYSGLAQVIKDQFAENISLLSDEQNALVGEIQKAVGAIGESLAKSVESVQAWNTAQGEFADGITGAIAGANAALPGMQTSVYKTALETETTTLATNVVQPVTLAFASTISDYKQDAEDLITTGKADVDLLVEENQQDITDETARLKGIMDGYDEDMLTLTGEMNKAAEDSLKDVDDTMKLADTSQEGWQAQMAALLEGIKETIGGVAAAAKSQDKLAISLAASVLNRFDRMITNLQDAMGQSAQSAYNSLASATTITGSASEKTTEELNAAMAEGSASSGSASGEQLTAISESSVNMMGSLADMLLSLHGLIKLQQAKLKDATDASNSAIEMVNDVIAGDTQDLASTINDITAQQQSALFAAKAHGMDSAATASANLAGIVAGVAGSTSRAVEAAETMFSDTQAASARQISDLSAQIQDAADASSHLQSALDSLSSSSSGTLGNIQVTAASLQTILTNTIAALRQTVKGAESSALSTLDQTNQTEYTGLIADAGTTKDTLIRLFSEFASYLQTANLTTFATGTLSDGAAKIPLDQLGGLLQEVVTSFSQETSALNAEISSKSSGYSSSFSQVESAAAQEDVTLVNDLVTLMTDVTQVPNIANAQKSSLEALTTAQSTSFETLNAIAATAADEKEVTLKTDALLKSADELVDQIPIDLAYENGQEIILFQQTLDAIADAVQDGLTASGDLDALIVNTTGELGDLNVTVGEQIANTSAIIDISSVIDQMNGFLKAVQDQQADFFEVTSNQAALRASLITNQQADIQLYKAKENINLIAAKSDYASRQSMLLKIADQLTKTIGDLAAISGSDVSAILAKLSDIRKTSDNLGSSLQAYVSTSGARMQAEAALAAKKLKTIAANNIMTRSLAVQAVTSNMATSLDMFNMTTHSLATMAAGNEGGLIGVSEMVQNLNSSATVQLQTLLSQVQDGTMSLKTALGIASQLNTADLDSISDIANAFSTIIYQYLALTEQTFADADQVLGDFNASAADTVNAYSSILLDALTPVNDLITLTQTVSGSLDKNFETELADLNGKLGEEQKISGEEVISVADSASFITQLIKNAASDYSEIEKKESEAVAALASWAQINYHGLLSSAAPSAANLLVDSANLAWIE